jgi:putative endonuclease
VICVYLLVSLKDRKQYIGSTSDLDRRLAEHNSGLVESTKYRQPLKLKGYQECDNLAKARLLEKSYKESHGRMDRAIKNGIFKIVGV